MRNIEQIHAELTAISNSEIKDLNKLAELSTEWALAYLEKHKRPCLIDQLQARVLSSSETWHEISQDLDNALVHIPSWMTTLIEQIEKAQDWIAQNTDAEEEALAAFKLYSREEDEFNRLRERLRGE